jgi:hypothetical protein
MDERVEAQDSVKLFVGQIPKDMNEDSLKAFFEEFGPISEITIIRDNTNLNHKGFILKLSLICNLIMTIFIFQVVRLLHSILPHLHTKPLKICMTK